MKTKIALFVGVFCIMLSSSVAHAAPTTLEDLMQASGKSGISCSRVVGDRTMVALVFGQSNSANHGQVPYESKREVYSFYKGKCYGAKDPLQGATGAGGSVWTRLGDKIIEGGLYEKVLIVPIGVGGTEIARWTEGGDLNPRIKSAIGQLKKRGVEITHMFWHQGESDSWGNTSKSEYKTAFMSMLEGIRGMDVNAPIYVAVATLCGGREKDYKIQQAQKELVNTKLNIYPGPDTDQIDNIVDRHDGCHFSRSGLGKHAQLWFNSIKYSE